MAKKTQTTDVEEMVLDFTDSNGASDFVVDFDSLPDNEPLPEGLYNVEVAKAEPALSKSGKPMVKLQLKVSTGEHEGTYLFDTLSFASPASMRIVKAKLRGLGMQGFNGNLALLSEEVVGAVAGANVGIRSGQMNEETGEPYPDSNTIKSYTSVTADVGDLI